MDFNPIYFTNEVLENAIRQKASDIHFHPKKETMLIRFRVDGQLQVYNELPIDLYPSLTNRLKVLSNLGSTTNNLPQDGRFTFSVDNKIQDLRISVIPSLYGESIVIRILNTKEDIPSLKALGMTESILHNSLEVLNHKEGLIVATGPTGSGKTTTMYSLLATLFNEKPYLHIVSIEDPIEYQFPEFTQVQVNENTGLSFPVVLRSVLRHDPDIILIGEIRDKDTAEIAIRAALTGHLVFATMHTNDTESTIHRFIEFKINPILLSDCMLAVYNQRLVRNKCGHCTGQGCENCHGTGYVGRIAEFDLLLIDDYKRQEIKGL
ncbi:MAG: hypothetical protein A2Y40_08160 [Candidatus Margulisbacteria bacterium GWF2_35_9]|nr:MAG: hypothetical protein A2Y40_08160 [Candidatus Margulisbacteria bacterium GWF2_35_9]